MHKNGILLLNLGTPDAPEWGAVCRYLRTFLMDKRVIELPYILRWILVHAFILPFRSPNTTKLYQKIWQSSGSPLLVNTRELTQSLSRILSGQHQVEFGMRYGNPSIESACEALIAGGCEEITVLPLFPQYSSAATGSALEVVYKFFAKLETIPTLHVYNKFYDNIFYLDALALKMGENLKIESKEPLEFLLFSYHGLPAKYKDYKRQCEETSDLIARKLNLKVTQYATSFQSRLGKIEWLKPYTDEFLVELIARGIKNLHVVCPSFVADCLETLEEINMGIRQRWIELGGHTFHYIPCLNSDPTWVETLSKMVHC